MLSIFIFRHRPKSSLSRGGARTPSATVKSIEETDENAPEECEAPKPPAPPAEDKPVFDEPAVKVTEDALKEVGYTTSVKIICSLNIVHHNYITDNRTETRLYVSRLYLLKFSQLKLVFSFYCNFTLKLRQHLFTFGNYILT